MDGGEKVSGPTGYSDYLVSCFDISRCCDKAAYECNGVYHIHNITNGISDGGTQVHNMLITCERSSIYQKDSFF